MLCCHGGDNVTSIKGKSNNTHINVPDICCSCHGGHNVISTKGHYSEVLQNIIHGP